MGRKPISGKAMTNAERQKRHRQKYKPITWRDKFLSEVAGLVSLYGNHLIAPEEMVETLGVLDDWVMGWRVEFWLRTKEGIESEARREERKRQPPPNPQESGEMIKRLVDALESTRIAPDRTGRLEEW